MGNLFRRFGFTGQSTEQERLQGAAALAAIGRQFLGADSPVANFALESAQGGLQQIAQQNQLQAEQPGRFNPSVNIFGPDARITGANPYGGGVFGGIQPTSDMMYRDNQISMSPLGQNPGATDFYATGNNGEGTLSPIMSYQGIGGPRLPESRTAEQLYGATPSPLEAGGDYEKAARQAALRSSLQPSPVGGSRIGGGPFARGVSSTVLGLTPKQVSDVAQITAFERKNQSDIQQQLISEQGAAARQQEQLKARKEELETSGSYDKQVAQIKGESEVRKAELESEAEQLKEQRKYRVEQISSINKVLAESSKISNDELYDTTGTMKQARIEAAVRQLSVIAASAEDDIVRIQAESAAKSLMGITQGAVMGADGVVRPASSPVATANPMTQNDQPTAGQSRVSTPPRAVIRQQTQDQKRTVLDDLHGAIYGVKGLPQEILSDEYLKQKATEQAWNDSTFGGQFKNEVVKPAGRQMLKGIAAMTAGYEKDMVGYKINQWANKLLREGKK